MSLRLPLCGIFCLCPLSVSTASPVTIEPDSAECCFSPVSSQPAPTSPDPSSPVSASPASPISAEGTTAPFSLRLHVTPDKKHRLCLHRGRDLPPVPLLGVDGRGQLLIGRFREWEECFDSRHGCQIMVYDFDTLPQGGSLTLHTELVLPVMGRDIRHRPVPLPAEGDGSLMAGGHLFRITPGTTDEESAQAGEHVLNIEYEDFPDMASLELTDAEGTPLVHKVVDGDRDEKAHFVRDTYLVKSRSTKMFLTLSTHPTFQLLRIPVSFRINISTASPSPIRKK